MKEKQKRNPLIFHPSAFILALLVQRRVRRRRD
jgi:hypothetical protein